MDDLRQRVSARLTALREWRPWMSVDVDGYVHPCRIAEYYLRDRVYLVAMDGGTSLPRLRVRLDDPATAGILAALVRQREPTASVKWGRPGSWRASDIPTPIRALTPGEAWGLAYLAVTEEEVTP